MVEGSKDAGYGLIILVAAGVLLLAGYELFSAVFSSDNPQRIFARASKLVMVSTIATLLTPSLPVCLWLCVECLSVCLWEGGERERERERGVGVRSTASLSLSLSRTQGQKGVSAYVPPRTPYEASLLTLLRRPAKASHSKRAERAPTDGGGDAQTSPNILEKRGCKSRGCWPLSNGLLSPRAHLCHKAFEKPV